MLPVVEVADSSPHYDRDVRSHIYGRSNVPETWVRNLPEDCVERLTQPGLDGYAQDTIHRLGETLTPVSFPDLSIAVDDLLSPYLSSLGPKKGCSRYSPSFRLPSTSSHAARATAASSGQ